MAAEDDTGGRPRTYTEASSFPEVIGPTGRFHAGRAWAESERPPGRAPNVLVVMLDDTGFADFGCYGSGIGTSTFNRLADGSLRYHRFHTTTVCSPSRACLLTGRNQHAVAMGQLPSHPRRCESRDVQGLPTTQLAALRLRQRPADNPRYEHRSASPARFDRSWPRWPMTSSAGRSE